MAKVPEKGEQGPAYSLLSMNIRKDLYDKLVRIAANEGITPDELVEQLIDDYAHYMH